MVNGDVFKLFQVEVTHPYTGEDDDELTLEKGDVIQVIPYSESDDPVRKTGYERGLIY